MGIGLDGARRLGKARTEGAGTHSRPEPTNEVMRHEHPCKPRDVPVPSNRCPILTLPHALRADDSESLAHLMRGGEQKSQNIYEKYL